MPVSRQTVDLNYRNNSLVVTSNGTQWRHLPWAPWWHLKMPTKVF